VTSVFWLKSCLDYNGKNGFWISCVLFGLLLLISLDLSSSPLFGEVPFALVIAFLLDSFFLLRNNRSATTASAKDFSFLAGLFGRVVG
jgi:hypothetical protein